MQSVKRKSIEAHYMDWRFLSRRLEQDGDDDETPQLPGSVSSSTGAMNISRWADWTFTLQRRFVQQCYCPI